MLADLRYDHDDSITVATLSGDVDMSNADDIGGALLRALTNDVLGLIVDLSDVGYFDSAGIHLVYDLRERLGMRGIKLRIVVPPDSRVRDTLELAGVLGAVDAAETLAAAQAELCPKS